MMKLLSYCFSACLFILLLPLCGVERLVTPRSISISIIIPCHYKHAIYLPGLLAAYAESTVLPEEVVISLSEAQLVPREIISEINEPKWPFPVRLLLSNTAASDGGNRNKACKVAKGDVFLCSDADDLPTPNRVEVVKYFFEHYDVDFLLHLFGNSEITDIRDIEWIVPKKSNDPFVFANGVPALTRRVFDRYKWDPAFRTMVDVDYNDRIYNKFPKTSMVIRVGLYEYRYWLSAYNTLFSQQLP